jgi:GNAT superfamily N-acetyltransferase
MTAYEISIDDHPSEADINTLIHNLVSYNDTQVEVENWQRLAIFIRDGRGEMFGGLCGYTHWGWLFISHLWVAESIRGQNYGKELVNRAERQAAKRGCHHAYLDTYDFQALGFYQKLGYDVFGSLGDFPTGHTRYFLKKHLL